MTLKGNEVRPDWTKAPVWAEYAAQELSGSLYWHERKPRYVEITGEWRSDGKTEIIPRVDRPAKDTLEIRP